MQRRYKEPVVHEVVEVLEGKSVNVTLCGKWLESKDYAEVQGDVTCGGCLKAKCGSK